MFLNWGADVLMTLERYALTLYRVRLPFIQNTSTLPALMNRGGTSLSVPLILQDIIQNESETLDHESFFLLQ